MKEHAGDGDDSFNWKNYGGAKTWPAPQGWDGEGQWPGPPDPVLDSGTLRVMKRAKTTDVSFVFDDKPAR